jgi:tRNA nucleotidyltransferase (CCA-adding enzyme)
VRNDFLNYPNDLNILIKKLKDNFIIPVLVGGYIRDYFLKVTSKDIDIELYNVNSFQELEEILKEFGSVNTVGKSFGVCKLSFKGLEIDFTLPRTDNKIATGHSGFSIVTDKKLDFKMATSRRDFTMNAIGYDIENKKILDPFYGREDIENKIIRAVDLKKFSQDPLRVFRAVSFAARFDFTIENTLFLLCKQMCEENLLDELSKERIYDEIKKTFFKSSFPSKAFYLLKKFKALKYLHPLQTLDSTQFEIIMYALDRVKYVLTKDKDTNLILFLSVLCSLFTQKEIKKFISNLSNKKNLSSIIYSIVSTRLTEISTDSQLLYLATKVNIELFLLYSQIMHPSTEVSQFKKIHSKAIKLDVLNTKQKEILRGRDLINFGIKPSKEYSKILLLAYEKQLNLEIKTHQQALQWLKNYLNL